ncbi:uncharacterized protein LOC123520484 [Portunus trituberculatus]|uniref:uncharacterized protein LOC123520484 n=1 Tax=Portunus trituberculatus TaxID=210409 RepID=UPI001E1D1094|nr:uncharacterized protein LOC123520484 [Portunus trituberculatus]
MPSWPRGLVSHGTQRDKGPALTITTTTTTVPLGKASVPEECYWRAWRPTTQGGAAPARQGKPQDQCSREHHAPHSSASAATHPLQAAHRPARLTKLVTTSQPSPSPLCSAPPRPASSRHQQSPRPCVRLLYDKTDKSEARDVTTTIMHLLPFTVMYHAPSLP